MRVDIGNNGLPKILSYIRDDPMMAALMNADLQDIDAWVDNNLTTLAGARAIMKRLIKIVVFLARMKIAEMQE